jgi:putative redox protein
MEKILTATLTNPNYELTVVDTSNNSMKIDIPENQGGNGNGMRPMQTMLAALCGCSAVDVVSILNKQKQQFSNLNFTVFAERESDKEPALWKTIVLQINISGTLSADKFERAVQLSIEKYCSVAETLRKAGATISFTTSIKN